MVLDIGLDPRGIPFLWKVDTKGSLSLSHLRDAINWDRLMLIVGASKMGLSKSNILMFLFLYERAYVPICLFCLQ